MTDHVSSCVEIGILDYPGSAKSVVFGLADMFDIANNECRSSTKFSQCFLKAKIFEITPNASAEFIGEFRGNNVSALIIPPTRNALPGELQLNSLSSLIVELHDKGATVVSICGGAYLLAASGLAFGRKITTHWAHRDLLQQQYPDITVDTEQLLIDGGDIISAGGLMAWTDIGLLLIDRYLGSEVMISTSRFMILNTAKRTQAAYSGFHPKLMHGDTVILNIQLWIHKNGGQDISVSDMADRAGLNLRTFIRRFLCATGFNPGEYCQRFRISASRNLLMVPGCTIEQAAWKSGYGDVSAYRKVFKRFLGVTPSEYKNQFVSSSSDE